MKYLIWESHFEDCFSNGQGMVLALAYSCIHISYRYDRTIGWKGDKGHLIQSYSIINKLKRRKQSSLLETGPYYVGQDQA